MQMPTRDVTITGLNANGVRAPVAAKLIICPECKGETFVAYLTGDSGHLHLQCVVCDTSFCDGSCSEGDNRREGRVSTERDSLIRMARWGRQQGKKNVIADISPLCEMADEIDRLEADLEKYRTSAEYYAAALGMCEAKLTHVRDELADAKADMEQVIGDVNSEPPRPAAMLWTDATEWHAYEQYEDADRDRNQAAKEPPLMVVKKWTWHPKSS